MLEESLLFLRFPPLVFSAGSGRAAREADPRAGFNFSAVNRRNFGENFVFGRYRKVVYRCFSVFFVLNFKISKKIINNHQKFGKNYDKKLGIFISL